MTFGSKTRGTSTGPVRRLPPWAVLLFLLLPAGAFAQGQTAGDASLRLEYQFIATGDFYEANVEFDYWTTDTHALVISGDYAINDRLSFYAALPYVQKKFNPGEQFNGDPHNPNDPWWIDFDPPDKRFIDDGDYHGGFQDLSFGLRYLLLDGPLYVRPFIGFGYPVTDYPFYGKAAIGTNLWNVPVGLSVEYVPYFSDWYVGGSLAYVFSEKPLDVNVDYWLGTLTFGYWFTARFSANFFVLWKYTIDGLILPWDFTDDPFYRNFPEDFDTPQWWQHDRLLQHRNTNAGLEMNFWLNEKYLLSGTIYTGIFASQSNIVDDAFTLAITRRFSGH